MTPSKEKQIYYCKYILYMLTFIITTTTNVSQKGPPDEIELADFGDYKVWQFSMYNIMIGRILVAKTLMGSHWINNVRRVPLERLTGS